jgi:hypothetical protein
MKFDLLSSTNYILYALVFFLLRGAMAPASPPSVPPVLSSIQAHELALGKLDQTNSGTIVDNTGETV